MSHRLSGMAATLARELGVAGGLAYAQKYARQLALSTDTCHASMAQDYSAAATALNQVYRTDLAQRVAEIHAAPSAGELDAIRLRARAACRGFPDDLLVIDDAIAVRRAALLQEAHTC